MRGRAHAHSVADDRFVRASAPAASMTGQVLIVPVRLTLPVRGASLHAKWTVTELVLRAVTSNVALPLQLTAPSVEVKLKLTGVADVLAGRPPTVAESLVLFDRSIEPVRAKPPGPVMVKLALLTCTPALRSRPSAIDPEVPSACCAAGKESESEGPEHAAAASSAPPVENARVVRRRYLIKVIPRRPAKQAPCQPDCR